MGVYEWAVIIYTYIANLCAKRAQKQWHSITMRIPSTQIWDSK